MSLMNLRKLHRLKKKKEKTLRHFKMWEIVNQYNNFIGSLQSNLRSHNKDVERSEITDFKTDDI